MHTPKQAPTSLKIVAALFVIAGISAGLDILLSFIHSNINFNLDVLGIFIGRGLLRFRPGWRTCALVFTWLALIFTPVFAILAASGSFPTYFTVFGQRVGAASPGLVALLFIAYFGLNFWQYRVLTRQDVVQLF